MKKANLFFLIVLFLLYMPFSVQSQIPSLISYQGTLTDDNGEPVSDGTYTMSFSLYDSETGTTTVWEEDQTVTVVNGIFNVLLGSVEEFDIEFDESYWLGISVGDGDNDAEMSPRVQLSSSPYSMSAKSVEDGVITSDKLADESVTQEKMDPSVSLPISGDAGGDLDGEYPNPQIARLQGELVSASNPSSGDVLKWTGSQWEAGVDANGGLSLPYSGTTSSNDYGFLIENTNSEGIAILGIADQTDGGSTGVRGATESPRGNGVVGENKATTAIGLLGSYADGLYSYTNDPDGKALWAEQGNNAEFAGYFAGDVEITGHLTKSSGSFKIDHPLEPEDKWLKHSFVESPNMMNVYDGTVTLDEQGEAWIELPEYFEELNINFRYQLTPIGAPGPDLYIAQEVSNNRFQIAGGSSGMEVSWQITGTRNDPYAQQNRIEVEVEKSDDERGKYMNPEVYGLPKDRSINSSRLNDREK